MAVQGISARDFFDLARFAWATYENIKLSRQNFANLNVDVECLLISVSALDQGHTGRLVVDYIDSDPSLEAHIDHQTVGDPTTTTGPSISQRQLEVRALRDGLHSVIFPFYVFLEKHTNAFADSWATEGGYDVDETTRGPKTRGPSKREPRPAMRTSRGMGADMQSTVAQLPDAQSNGDRRMWNRLPLWVRRLYASFDLRDMSEIRSRFAVQAANLNLFLTRLTHMQLQKQTSMLTLRLAEDNLLNENWEYSRDLKKGEARFREDVALYVRHLLKGGMPFTEQELRRKAVEDDFVRQRREDRKWAVEKIAEENKRREQLKRESMRRKEEETKRPVLARIYPQQVSLSDAEVRYDPQTSVKDDRTARPGLESRRESSYEKGLPRRSPLEATLSADAMRTLDDARRRLYRAEDEGLLDDEDVYDVPQYTPVATQPQTRRRGDTLTVGRDDPKRHSYPGIMVSPPPQHSEPASKEGKRLSSSASPDGRRDSSSKQPSGSANTTSSKKPPQSEPMQHSLSASPRLPPVQTARRPSTPAGSSNPVSNDKTPTPRRSPTRVLLCDQCNASIRLNEYFWRCSTGKCAAEGQTYDLCERCMDRGYRCRGIDQGTCDRMICTMIKGAEP